MGPNRTVNLGPNQTVRFSLCTPCHESTHFGFAQVQGNEQRALAHLMEVNQWTHPVAQRHIEDAFVLWEERSRNDWTLDLSILTTAGVRLMPPPGASARRAYALDPLD